MAHPPHTATETIAAIKAGTLTAEDNTQALLSTIEAREPDVQAWAFLDRGLALQQAKGVDQLTAKSAFPLVGVAVGVKDIIDTADMPTENGTPLDAGRKPQADADVVARLRRAGALIMGKTVTTELAFLQPSKTRNPVNIEHTPGGSSSGSAAAVAAGMVPLALGTQTNGSVIRPASFCGVYGFKPTHELFSRKGVTQEAQTLDTVGVFARSLEDVSAVTDVLAEGQPGYRHYPRRAPKSPRFAFVKTPVWHLADKTAQDALTAFCESLGSACDTVELPPAFEAGIALHRAVMVTEMAMNYRHYEERDASQLSEMLRKTLAEGREVRAVAYAEAIAARETLYAAYCDAVSGYDAVITLPARGAAPKGLGATGDPVFCTTWTYLGVPALSLPLLEADGLPLGVQLVGYRHDDRALLAAASSLVELTQTGRAS
jgi:Asp-tRNA(Asn)/Glu-tRNA(Gln) amidotransferase A subunit family amidase